MTNDALDDLVQEIEKGIKKQHPKQLETKSSEDRDLDYWAKYNGEDKIISSDEAKLLVEEAKKKYRPIYSSIEKLDSTLNGFIGGEVVVITGQTSHGKTLFAQTLTHNFFINNISVLWFSYEVSMEQLYGKFENMKKNEEEIALYYLPAKNEPNSLGWLEDKIKESKAKQLGTKAIFIDHLDYIVPFSVGGNRADLIGETMRKIKTLAIEYNCTIFVLAHVQKIEDSKEPEIANIRSSSFISQEADTVLYVKRLVEYESDSNDSYLYILKNRRVGNLGRILMSFENGKLIQKVNDFIENRG